MRPPSKTLCLGPLDTISQELPSSSRMEPTKITVVSVSKLGWNCVEFEPLFLQALHLCKPEFPAVKWEVKHQPSGACVRMQ